jgi:tRNA dimethylallyltransferase
VLDMLDGRMDEPATREAIVTATRRFARRQLRWWRSDSRVQWADSAEAAVAAVTSAP